MRFAVILIFLALISLWHSIIRAAVPVYQSPDTRTTAETQAVLERVDRWMNGEMSPSPELAVVFSDRAQDGISYSFSRNAIFLSELAEPFLVHEYAHALLDEYMVKNSRAWAYFKARSKAGRMDLTAAVPYTKDEIVKLERTKADYEKSNADPKILQNLSRAIAQNRRLLEVLERSLPDEAKYKPLMEKTNFFALIAPYHELFADTLAVAISDDWSLMSRTSKESLEKSGETLNVPDGGTAEKVFWHRGFHLGISVEEYTYADWEAADHYTQFAPMRSSLRERLEGVSKTERYRIIVALAGAISAEFELRVQDAGLHELSLKEKNRRLKRALDTTLK